MEIGNPKKTQPDLYKQLVNAIAEDRTIAMVGAGSSVRMGYPSWDGLLKLLSTQAAKIDPSRDDELTSLRQVDPLLCADKIKKTLGPVEFYSQLEKIFGPLNPEYDTFHEFVVSLPFSHFLTTNYDRILQVAHEGCQKSEYVELDLDSPQVSGNFFDIIGNRKTLKHFIHVHGSIRNPEGMVLALEDYNERYGKRTDLIELLKHVFTCKVVFIGFSLEDEDFMGPLKFLTSCLGTGEPRHFAILPEPSDKEKITALCQKFRARFRIEPFFYDPRNDHAILMTFLKELNEDVKKRQLELIKEKVISFNKLGDETTQFANTLKTIQEIEYIAKLTISSNLTDTTSPDSSSHIKLDSEIDKIFSHVKSGNPIIAIEMYKAIIEREGDSLINRLKYRLHANIGNALCSMNKHEEASREYILATDYWSSTKESQALRAFGYILHRNYQKAFEIADRICKEHPDYPRAYALRLQSLHGEYSFKEARKSVPLKIRRDPEVAYALSVIAHEQGLQKRSEVYSKIVWQSSPDWIEAGLSYATALLISEKDKAIISGGTKLIPLNRDRVQEAESILTGLLAKLQQSDPANRKGIIFYNRSSARRLLGLNSDARSDIEEAYRHDRNDPNTISAYVLQREQDAGRDEAIRILNQHDETQNHAILSFLLSNMLFQRSNKDDLSRSLSILMPWCKKIDKVTPASHRYDFFRLISEILLKMDRTKDAVDLLDITSESVLSSSHKQFLLLWMQIESKTIDINDAKRTCEKVACTLGSHPEYYITREIALCADKIKHYPLSFELWKKITTPQDFNPDTNSLLRAAQNTKEYQFIIDFCTQLRKNEIHERNGYISEIQANIECHEFNEALKLMETWLTRKPDDKEMRLNLSLLASDIGEEQYFEVNPDKLPTINEVPNAEYGTRVVQSLRQSGNSCAAILYAYELWRRFPDEMVAQHTLISTVIESDQNETILEKPEEVKFGSAVIYKAADSDEYRTHIIEVGPSPSMARSEYSPNHDISKLLLRKKIGDSILINGREWSILEINNKYVYTTSNLLKEFDMDFPGNPLLRKFPIPKKLDSSVDPQEPLGEIRAYMQDEESRKKKFEEFYQRGSLPVTSFAKFMDKSVLETMMYLAASSNHKIRVCSGASGEFDGALKILKKGCKLVLDETAIATLFMLLLYSELDRLPYELIIPETLVHEIRRVAKLAAFNRRSSLFLGISNGNLLIQRVSPTEHANWINSLEELLASIKYNCTIEGGKALLDIESNARENLIQNLGPANADAIAIAKKSESVYWTDDLLSGSLASELNIKNVWSQVVLRHVMDMDKSFISRYNKAEKDMFLWGYDFTAVHIQTIISAFIDAKWNLEDYRIKYVLEFIGKLGGINEINCHLTCILIIRIWLIKSIKRKKACELIILLLNKIGRNISGPQIARKIYRNQLKLPDNQKIRSLKHMLRTWRTNPNNG